MKKVILLLTVLCCLSKFSANAQSYTDVADSLLLHLNKSAIPTGILYDRAFPLAGVQSFNSFVPDTANHGYFLEAYGEMYNSAYSKTGWLPLDTITLRAYMVKSSVPVGLAFYTYNLIDTNAIGNNLIQMHSDSLYYDTPGRIASPYNTVSTFVASPLVDSVSYNGGVTFSFPLNLFVNKSSLSVTSLKVDFSDGIGLVNVALGSTHFVNYSLPSGYRYLKFVVTMSNGLTYTTYAQIKVYGIGPPLISAIKPRNLASQSCSLVSTTSFFSDGRFQGYDESSATQGFGQLEIHYASNNCDGVLKKPIIIMDGFDPQDGIPIYQLYNYFNGVNVWNGYLDNMLSQGYDVVLLNFPMYYNSNGVVIDGGSDYIERNAQVLIKAIDYVNQNKTGTEKNIIIGPSMGGLVARYALAYMEQHNHLHNTKLYVSFDAPHNGANVPIGDQQFLNYYGEHGSSQAGDVLTNTVNTHAAKQMLINHYLYQNGTSSGGAPGFRDRFNTALNTIGFPNGDPGQSFRKIAIVDGSLGGTTYYSAGQTGFAYDLTWYFHYALYKKLFFFKVRLLELDAKVGLAHAVMYFTPNASTTGVVLRAGRIFAKPKVANFTMPPYTSSFDNAPGGLFDSQGQIYDNSNGTAILSSTTKEVTTFSSLIKNHSFINTKSALAFSGTNLNLSENISTRNLVCTKETPFDSYYGSFTTNSNHIQLSSAASNWLTQEILGNPQLPPVNSTTTYTINGAASLCSSSTYSINSLQASAIVTWSASPAGIVTLAPSGQQVTLTKVNTGNVTLSATISNNCVPSVVTPFSVAVGILPLTVNSTVDRTPQSSHYQYLTATATQLPNTTSSNYSWYLLVNNQPTTLIGTGLQLNHYPIAPCTTIYYQCQVTTACGLSTYSSYAYNTYCGTGSAASQSVIAYPNPTSNTLTVTNYDILASQTATTDGSIVTSSTTIPQAFRIKLYNDKGKILKSASNENGNPNIVIDIRDVPNGTFYLHIIKGSEVIEKQIVVQH